MRGIMRGECSADDNTGTNSVFLHISQNTGLPYCFIKKHSFPRLHHRTGYIYHSTFGDGCDILVWESRRRDYGRNRCITYSYYFTPH